MLFLLYCVILHKISCIRTKKNNNNKSLQSWDIQKQYATRLKSIAWALYKSIHHYSPTFGLVVYYLWFFAAAQRDGLCYY